MIFSQSSVLAALAVSSTVGIAAGYPSARHAEQLDPVEAWLENEMALIISLLIRPVLRHDAAHSTYDRRQYIGDLFLCRQECQIAPQSLVGRIS